MLAAERACGASLSLYAQPILPRTSANLAWTGCTSSGLARATRGKSFSRSNGRQASITARELVELARSSIGSSGPLQARRTNSMSFCGIASRAHRPNHVEQVGRIDILVDHGDEPSEIRPRLATGGEQAGLAGMARISLLDGDYVEHARATEFMHHTPVTPDRPARSTSSQIMPAFITHLLNEKSDGGCIGDAIEDRIVAIIDPLDLDHRLLTRARRIISGEFAERSFLRDDLDHLAFEHDLGVRGHRQPVQLAQHDLIGLSAMATGIIVFRQPGLQFVAAGKEQQRIVTAADQHRAGLAVPEILLSNLPPMLARRDPDLYVVLILHHDR